MGQIGGIIRYRFDHSREGNPMPRYKSLKSRGLEA